MVLVEKIVTFPKEGWGFLKKNNVSYYGLLHFPIFVHPILSWTELRESNSGIIDHHTTILIDNHQNVQQFCYKTALPPFTIILLNVLSCSSLET